MTTKLMEVDLWIIGSKSLNWGQNYSVLLKQHSKVDGYLPFWQPAFPGESCSLQSVVSDWTLFPSPAPAAGLAIVAAPH